MVVFISINVLIFPLNLSFLFRKKEYSKFEIKQKSFTFEKMKYHTASDPRQPDKTQKLFSTEDNSLINTLVKWKVCVGEATTCLTRGRDAHVNSLQETTKTINWNEKLTACQKGNKITENKIKTEQQKYNSLCNSKYSLSIYKHIFFTEHSTTASTMHWAMRTLWSLYGKLVALLSQHHLFQ